MLSPFPLCHSLRALITALAASSKFPVPVHVDPNVKYLGRFFIFAGLEANFSIALETITCQVNKRQSMKQSRCNDMATEIIQGE